MNILITGATGYIGRNIVEKLIKDNQLFCTLIENELNPYEKYDIKTIQVSQSALEENIDFVKKNNIQGIIHLASLVQASEHKTSEVDNLIRSNILFGTLILEIARQANVKWIINTGTYWQNFDRSHYSAVNLYAATKQAFQDILHFYAEAYNLKVCTIKLFDTYGPYDSREKLFTLWQKVGKLGLNLNMSYGNQIIDLSYIDDVVNAYYILAQHLNNNDVRILNKSVYFVKSSRRYTLKELAKIFEDISGYKLNINWGGRPYRPREIMNPIEIGQIVPDWSPLTELREGILKILNETRFNHWDTDI